MLYIFKVVLSSLIIVAFTEIAKKSNFWAAILISLPLTSILALCLTYYEKRDVGQIINLSNEILFLVIPSLLFFIILPLLLKYNFHFALAITLACLITAIGYFIMGYITKNI